MAQAYLERESKFDVPADFVLPSVAGATEPTTHHLRSEYFDTADRRLLQAGVTLRRRRGSTDLGWQLKVPHPPYRTEIRLPLDAPGEPVPQELADLLRGAVAGGELLALAILDTQRTVRTVSAGDGTPLAELADDVVSASCVGDQATATTWREVEIELFEGAVENTLRTIGAALLRAGAHPSAATSKLARAVPAPAPAVEPGTAASVVLVYLTDQYRALIAGDVALRRGEIGRVHKTRVAIRRLRSALRVFGSLFDPGHTAALDDELRWMAGVLGAVRDSQVLDRRLRGLLDEVDEADLLGPVSARIHGELAGRQAESWEAVQAALAGARYVALLGLLGDWLRQPALASKGSRPVGAVPRLVRKAERKASRRLSRAAEGHRAATLHSARKAAKRARYASEAARPVLGGKRSKKHAKRYEALQDLLGEHQDAMLSTTFLRRLGGVAGSSPGENGFAFGVLYEREWTTARRISEEAVAACDRLS
ncbi:MAG: CHAD domain-containing protein [Jatrophihabitans sp.]